MDPASAQPSPASGILGPRHGGFDRLQAALQGGLFTPRNGLARVNAGSVESGRAVPTILPEARIRAALARSRAARMRRAATGASETLCRETEARLFDHLDPVRLEPRWVIDLAMQCGMRDRLAERYPGAMIASCGYFPAAAGSELGGRTLAVAANPMALPLAAGSTDLVASNLGLVWYTEPGPVFREAWRVLRPGGLIAFVTLGPGTLTELRRSWAAVDDRSHIIDFVDMHDVGDAMVGAGFGDVVMDAERITVTWPDVPALLRELRGLGTGNPLAGRPAGLTTPRKLGALVDAYRRPPPPDGLVQATVELVHGHGWKPEAQVPVAAPEAFSRLR